MPGERRRGPGSVARTPPLPALLRSRPVAPARSFAFAEGVPGGNASPSSGPGGTSIFAISSYQVTPSPFGRTVLGQG